MKGTILGYISGNGKFSLPQNQGSLQNGDGLPIAAGSGAGTGRSANA